MYTRRCLSTRSQKPINWTRADTRPHVDESTCVEPFIQTVALATGRTPVELSKHRGVILQKPSPASSDRSKSYTALSSNTYLIVFQCFYMNIPKQNKHLSWFVCWLPAWHEAGQQRYEQLRRRHYSIGRRLLQF